MKELKNGVLGVVVISLAIVGALFGSYFAGIEAEEHEVTKYQYLADVSGLFSYDKSPQYIEYDPSTNYTGYYSEDSGQYWPTEAVEYTKSVESNGNPRVNNYKINLEPLASVITTADLSSLSDDDVPGFDRKLDIIWYYTGEEKIGNYIFYDIVESSVYSTTLSTVLSTLQYGGMAYQNYDIIKIASPTAIFDISDASADDPIPTGWILFFPSNWATPVLLDELCLPLIAPDVYDGWEWNPADATIKTKPSLSCIINVSSQTAELYAANDFTDLIGVFALSDVSVAHGLKTPWYYEFELGNSANVTLIDYPTNEYLDPSQGVKMKEAQE